MHPTHVKFLSSVLPDAGIYVAVWKTKDDPKMHHKTMTSLNDLIAWCDYNGQYLVDSWFALSTYKQGWHKVDKGGEQKWQLRTQSNAQYAKCLWADLDVGGEKKPYATREEAAQALLDTCRVLGLPRPWVVASGAAGLHVYWAFDEAVDIPTWQQLAGKFFQACKQHNLLVDPSRAREPASILRAPGTWNCKDMDNPAHVHVLVEGASAPVALYEEKLAKYVATDVRGMLLPKLPAVVPSFPAEAIPGAQKYFPQCIEVFPEEDPVAVMRNCRQMNPAYMDEWQGEPHFRGFLATIRHCANGTYVAHKVASLSKYYTGPEYTRKKLDALTENRIAPYRCETFASINPKGCEGCPFAGMVNSPIGTPRLVKEQPKKADEGQEDETADEEAAKPVVIETKRAKVNELGCFALTSDGNGGQIFRHVYEYPVYPIQRVRDRSVNGDVQVSYVIRKHGYRGYDDIQIPGDVLLGNGVGAYLGSVGFLLGNTDKKLMAGLLIDILKETEHSIPEVRVNDNLGWDADRNTFLLGNKLYRRDGEVIEIAPKGKARSVSEATVPKGTLGEWKEIAEVYNKPGMEWAQAAVLTAFASPIMCMGALEKAALLFLKGSKGCGKSTALMLAVSVYGNPSELMINKDDTYLARIDKLGVLHNLSAGFDEMTDLSPREASEMAYQITQGRGKDRMMSSGEGVQRNTTRWSCLPVMTANDSIISTLAMHKADASAQMSRVLEVSATDVGTVYTAQELASNERLVRKIYSQFGTAGDAYIRYIVTRQEYIERLIEETEQMFRRRSGLGNADRFWIYMATRLIVGLKLAREAGLVAYDEGAFVAYLLDQVAHNMTTINQLRTSPESAIAVFLNAHVSNRLIVQTPRRPRGMTDDVTKGPLNDFGYVVQTPTTGREILVRVELSTRNVIISLVALKRWCTENGVVYTDVLRHLANSGSLVKEKASQSLGHGTAYRGTGAIDCLVIKAPAELIEEMSSADPDGGE